MSEHYKVTYRFVPGDSPQDPVGLRRNIAIVSTEDIDLTGADCDLDTLAVIEEFREVIPKIDAAAVRAYRNGDQNYEAAAG
tara:strand:+ start:1077 stop:1319 length:243 start_codon:yes stop_codon:yes gene_type:complete